MIRYHQQECPHCHGSGSVQRHSGLTMTCPLCWGKGTINNFDRPIEEPTRPEKSAAIPTHTLLARVTPIGKKPTTALLSNRHGSIRPHRSTSETLGEDYEPVAGEPIKL